MKIRNWNNLENEGFRKTKFGNYIKNTTRYYYCECCIVCKEPFLSKNKKSKFCSVGCSNIHNKTGTHKSEESKQKVRDLWKNPNSKYNTKEYRRKLISKGNKNGNWKGGYHTKDIPVYDIFAHQIEWCEKVRRNKKDPNILEVKCFKCNKWYIPTIHQVNNRIQCLADKNRGEQHFYCSDQCKNSCSIYGKMPKTLMKEDAIRAGRISWLELNREVQYELKQIVLERDNNKCIKCGNTENLQCHHILPVNIEPLLSVDVDNCITLCIDCHKEAHTKDGCNYSQLQIEEC